MSVSLAQLEKDLERALDIGDQDMVASVRTTIGDQHPKTDAGAEANYKLGLQSLFVHRNAEHAVDRLREAAKAKSATWTPSARVALAMVLFRQGKAQQSLFELRKVSGVKPSTLSSAQAMGFMVIIHRDLNQPDEAARVREDQLKTLTLLTKDEHLETAAMANYMLGMEYKFDGQRKEAAACLRSALEVSTWPEDDRSRIQAALDSL